MGYFQMLGELSERVRTVEIGRSTKDNPFLMAVISSPENLVSLTEYKRIQSRLADARTIPNDDEAEQLIGRGRAVVAITCSIHATEVGATQMSMLLAHELATGSDAGVQDVLDSVILLLIPCANPDGLVDVKEWYESTLGESYEGVMPPFLYQHYTGHDNNRDWFMFTQQETRLVVEHCFNAWRPHVVLDMHQTRSNGVRMMVPPFVDPMGPNVDAILNAESAMLGAAIAADLTAEGKAGVSMNVVYDAYSPNRSYQQYHGGVRMLTEAAGARIATPVNVPERDLQSDRGETPKEVTWKHPMPWKGGTWRLRDIVEYDFTAAMSCLRHSARLRETLVRNFYKVGRNAIEQNGAPYAFVIPTQQHDHSAAAEMLDALRLGLVEVHEATEAFRARWTAVRRRVAGDYERAAVLGVRKDAAGAAEISGDADSSGRTAESAIRCYCSLSADSDGCEYIRHQGQIFGAADAVEGWRSIDAGARCQASGIRCQWIGVRRRVAAVKIQRMETRG